MDPTQYVFYQQTLGFAQIFKLCLIHMGARFLKIKSDNLNFFNHVEIEPANVQVFSLVKLQFTIFEQYEYVDILKTF